jgi:hypothetical protein
MPLHNPLASAIAGTAMDLVDAPNATAVTALQSGLATAASIGTPANTGGTATIAAILGDPANESLAYRIMEIERHLHGYERWFGLAGTPDAELHRADRIGTTTAAFQVDAGNNTWGSWLQILGSSDTPADGTNAKFDLHKLMIVDCERDGATHLIQIAAGASGAAALTAGTYTEFVYRPQATNTEELPYPIMMRRQNAGTKIWARVWSVGQNTGTIDFFIGLHEYAA